METIILKCQCQKYLGVPLFHSTMKSIIGSSTVGNKVQLIELNISEDKDEDTGFIEFFVLKVKYNNPLQLCTIIAYVATEFEESQINEHGDSGGFWILNEHLPLNYKPA